jgi:hypothetical protein
MTSERAQAYGRVTATIAELGATKLQANEVERIRTAADTLLFAEDLDAAGAREALADVERLMANLVESGRWTEERAQRLFDDLAETGPVTRVG